MPASVRTSCSNARASCACRSASFVSLAARRVSAVFSWSFAAASCRRVARTDEANKRGGKKKKKKAWIEIVERAKTNIWHQHARINEGTNIERMECMKYRQADVRKEGTPRNRPKIPKGSEVKERAPLAPHSASACGKARCRHQATAQGHMLYAKIVNTFGHDDYGGP